MILKRDEFLKYYSCKGHVHRTVKRMALYINQFARWLDKRSMREVTASMVKEYRRYLMNDYKKDNGQKLSSLTVLAKLGVIKTYFMYLAKNRYILLDPTLNLELPTTREHIPKNILTQAEMACLLKLTLKDKDIFGIRNRAILELLYSTGIRRAELCKLDVYDINLKERVIHIRAPKNREDRVIPVGQKAIEGIEEYLSQAREQLSRRKKSCHALFLNQYGQRMRGGGLYYIVVGYAKKMRLEKNITPHCLRHSCATHLLQNGADLSVIQKILGHTRIRTTQIYTRVVPKDLKDTLRRYHPRCKMTKKRFK